MSEQKLEPGQRAYEAWMLTYFGPKWPGAHDYWSELPLGDQAAWAAAEQSCRESERAAVVRSLRSGLSTQDRVNLSHDIERGKHLENSNE